MNSINESVRDLKEGRLPVSDEEWGWLCSERYMGRGETELARSREKLERERFLDMLQTELENDRELQQALYALILAKK